LKSRDVGHLKLFYHPTYPDDRQAIYPFSWGLYFGLAGKGPESIMPDWVKRGIVLEIIGMDGGWESTIFTAVQPLHRVRISYPKPGSPERAMYEVIFPRAYKEAVVPLLLLE
jgi:hypothetical protein